MPNYQSWSIEFPTLKNQLRILNTLQKSSTQQWVSISMLKMALIMRICFLRNYPHQPWSKIDRTCSTLIEEEYLNTFSKMDWILLWDAQFLKKIKSSQRNTKFQGKSQKDNSIKLWFWITIPSTKQGCCTTLWTPFSEKCSKWICKWTQRFLNTWKINVQSLR